MDAVLMLKSLSFAIFALFVSSTASEFCAKYSNFSSDTVFYGDAKVVNGGRALQLTSPESSGAGRVLYRKPIKLVGGNNQTVASFSTCFSFSVSPENGDGLAFVIVPGRLQAEPNLKTLAVRFRSLRSAKIDARIELETQVSNTTISKAMTGNLNLSFSPRVHSWINYEVGNKRLEIRVADEFSRRPFNPLLSSTIDFYQIFKNEKVFVELSCSNKDSRQSCLVYSFNFSLHPITKLVHSQPLNPGKFKVEKKKKVAQAREENRSTGVSAALVFGSCCLALTASMALFLWTIFRRRRCVTRVSEEIQIQDPEDEKNQSL